MTERALSFARDPLAYDQARPDYPAVAVDHVLGLTEARHAVEIGAGTGKATLAFARPGLEILAVEPAKEMAEVLARRSLPGVEVVVSTFESWPGPDRAVDLVFAAQSWHWVDHSSGYDRVRDMLRPGGVVALIWNVPDDRYRGLEAVYREHAPEVLADQEGRIGRRDSHAWLEELQTAGFHRVDLFTHGWKAELSAARHRLLCSSYSDHIMIPEPRRTRLLDALEGAVAAMGGTIVLHYETRVFAGVR